MPLPEKIFQAQQFREYSQPVCINLQNEHFSYASLARKKEKKLPHPYFSLVLSRGTAFYQTLYVNRGIAALISRHVSTVRARVNKGKLIAGKLCEETCTFSLSLSLSLSLSSPSLFYYYPLISLIAAMVSNWKENLDWVNCCNLEISDARSLTPKFQIVRKK